VKAAGVLLVATVVLLVVSGAALWRITRFN
jgi:hypothetical protein